MTSEPSPSPDAALPPLHDLETLAIALPDAPPIPGLRFRHWAGEPDLPEMVRVCNLARRADGDPEVATVEETRIDYRHLTNCDPARDILMAEVDGRLVAYGRVLWEDQNDGGRAYESFAFVDPAWQRRGIGRAMLHHFGRRASAIAATHDIDRPRTLQTWGYDRNVGNRELLESEGYTVVRRFVQMVRPTLDAIEVPPMPAGLELRPGHADQARAVFLADVDAFRDHWGSLDDSDVSFARWSEQPSTDPSLWVVAWDGDEIAGAVLNLISPEENEEHGYLRGWLDSVFVRRPWRKRGLAKALIGRSLVLLRERGMTSAALGVDVDNVNRALDLYTGAGFEVDRSESVWSKPLPEVATTT